MSTRIEGLPRTGRMTAVIPNATIGQIQLARARAAEAGLADDFATFGSSVRAGRLTSRRSAASRASGASGPSEGEGGESAATPC